jgi:ABC-type polysaccharide/polyol phosphate transport system ATPase subunit
MSYKIEIINLFKAYGKKNPVEVLKNINLNINNGECVGFLGKNGSGKSTLLKLIAGVTNPTSGLVKSKGKLLPMLEVGTGFNPELSCYDNVILYNALIGLNQNIKKDEVKNIFEFAELIGEEKKPVKYLSTGMYMRLAFSVAVNQNPDIILIDEVLAVGDGSFQKKCINKILELKKRTSIIFVSHNLSQLEQVCDIGVVFNNGEIQYKGIISDAVDFYNKNILEN